jgi:dipeptidyl aminopeptidase/acylaminoacyl peptidase
MEEEKAVGDRPYAWSYDPAESAGEEGRPAKSPRLRIAANLNSALIRLSVENGEPERLTPDVRSYAWSLSPDGTAVAYLQYSGAAADPDFMIFWDLMLLPLDGGEARPLVRDLPQLSGISFSWSPKGESIAYYSSDTRDVFLVPVEGGEPANLTAAFPEKPVPRYTEGSPVWRGDGSALFFAAEGGLWELSREGDLRRWTGEDDAPIAGLITDGSNRLWSPDGAAYARSRDPETKRESVFRIDREGGMQERVFETAASLFGFTGYVDAEGNPRFCYMLEDASRPPDLWSADLSFRNRRRLSHLNPRLETLDFTPPRLVEWAAEDGRALRGALLLPPGYDPAQRIPVVAFLYPGENLSDSLNRFGLNGTNRGNLHILTARGYGVLAMDAPVQTNEPMKEFPRLVLPALDRLVETGVADPDRFGVMGHSYGGYAVNCLLTQTTRFKAAVSIAGVSNLTSEYLSLDKDGSGSMYTSWAELDQGRMGGTLWEERRRYIENSPVFFLDQAETPLLLLHGEEDVHPHPAQSKEMFAGLRRLGKPVSLALYPGEGHHYVESWRSASICDLWGRILEWFGRYL